MSLGRSGKNEWNVNIELVWDVNGEEGDMILMYIYTAEGDW